MPELNFVTHPIPPVWNEKSRVLLLGTMPSPKSREAGFFYMHPQNRFWKVMAKTFDESFEYRNDGMPNSTIDCYTTLPEKTIGTPDILAAIAERRNFLLRHGIALWDVLASCEITGASDSSIKNAIPNDFSQIFNQTKIQNVFCTGKTAFSLWQKYCAPQYESRYGLTAHCLPSTSPANAAWNKAKLVDAYRVIREVSVE